MADIVIFRKDPPSDGGNVFALFPEIPSDRNGLLCTSYEHVGQHSGADYYGCIQRSKPAKPEEYDALRKELEGRGYALDIRQRATYAAHQNRRHAAYQTR